MSMVLPGKLYFKSILAGVPKAFSSCLTKLRRSEVPDSLGMRISRVELRDFLVSSSEMVPESPEVESAWKTCAQRSLRWRSWKWWGIRDGLKKRYAE